MAVPQRKTSKSRKNLRRAHHALRPASLGRCKNCGQATHPHRICPNCGFYNGRVVIDRDTF
jgi:large subunit ribosomal protein L32